MKVVWMYHDIMDLYGDKGNMMVLKKRCLDRGIPFELDTCGIGEEKDLSEYDLIFLGGGADKEQISLIPDLLFLFNLSLKILSGCVPFLYLFLTCSFW